MRSSIYPRFIFVTLFALPLTFGDSAASADQDGHRQPDPNQAAESQTPPRFRLAETRTLGQALDELGSEIGIEFRQPGDPTMAITPVDKPLTFWPALDHVLDEADLDIDRYGGDRQSLQLRPRRPGRPSRVDSATYTGPYRLEPTVVTSRRVFRTEALNGLGIEIELGWLPGVTPIGVTLPLDRLVAKLDDGQTIRASGAGNVDVATGREIPIARFQLPLQLPVGQPQSIVTLAGEIRSLLPGPPHRFEFSLNEIGEVQTRQAATVVLEDVRKNGELHELRLAVDFESPGAAMESHRGFLLDNQAVVVFADGSRTEPLGYELYRQSETGIGIGYLFAIGPTAEEARLVYETPTSIVSDETEFLIRDIGLP